MTIQRHNPAYRLTPFEYFALFLKEPIYVKVEKQKLPQNNLSLFFRHGSGAAAGFGHLFL